MPERVIMVHYHEIGLKGRNRSLFERRLQANLQAAVEGLTEGNVERIASRLLVPVTDEARLDELLAVVAGIPGISYIADAYVTARDLDTIERIALQAMRDAGPAETFKVDARRSATDFPISSLEMNQRVGAFLGGETGVRVKLDGPDVTVRIEVVQGAAYVYARRIEGPGGLPVGTSGKIVTLLSAGIDSPVAAWRLMKRGAVIVGAHFSGRPQTDALSERNVVDIGRSLERFGGIGRIYLIPIGDLQREISLAAPPDLRVLLYRRLMLRVSEEIARLERAKALATGESLGQVASQTLDNIAAVDAAATMPVLRPLIGLDKLEIINTARRIGTYEISTRVHADCCTLFMPRMPATHATVHEVDAAEAALDVAEMVARALREAAWQDFACPSYRPPKRTLQEVAARS